MANNPHVELRLSRSAKSGGTHNNKLLPPRELAWRNLMVSGLWDSPRENSTLTTKLEPWKWNTGKVEFHTNLQGIMGKDDAATKIEVAVRNLLDQTQPHDIVCYTDGSAEDGTTNGGAGGVIFIPEEEEMIVHKACGTTCSSYRAEMMAIEQTLEAVLLNIDQEVEFERKLWMITDSQSAISSLQQGPGASLNAIGQNIWSLLQKLSERRIKTVFQWVPGHRGIPGNAKADKAAGEAGKLDQSKVPIDFDTSKAHLRRYVVDKWKKQLKEQDLFLNKATAGRPKRLNDMTRADEVTIHQLRTGKTPLVAHCLAKYKGLKEEKGFCLQGCKEKETVEHLLTCPIYERQRREVFDEDDVLKALNNTPGRVLEFLKRIGRTAAPELEE